MVVSGLLVGGRRLTEDWKKEARECKLTKRGTDTWIGNYFSAPCGWSTYNKYDISHYEWHRRGLAQNKAVDEKETP